ncbi:MAG TPA: hypothetical protein VJL54_08170 [Nitrososphaera sp.]|nr:hypothetical protein [Nitrososphaera sp.]
MSGSSCRSCGGLMAATIYCEVCRESTSWVCRSCERIEDATHKHR